MMYVKIPFESIIEFKTNIAEITKMSLEHDYNISEGLILGNFYVSGEYKAHELSVNVEPFKYTLPFTVELREDIKKDTLEFNIEDFSYEIEDKTKLKVNIEYSLKAEEELFERVNEEELNSELEFIDDFINQGEIQEQQEEKEGEIEVEEDVKQNVNVEDTDVKDNVNISVENNVNVEVNNTQESDNDEEGRIGKEEEKTIMETIKDSDDTFVTYHVHIVKESESLETIASMYNVPSCLLSEYNNIDSLSTGDKVLIPKSDE